MENLIDHKDYHAVMAHFYRGELGRIMADEHSADERKTKGDGNRRLSPQESEEAKRLEARRKFLLGGAAAIPALFTAKRANATITLTYCAEMLEQDYPDQYPEGSLTQIVPFFRQFEPPGSFLEGVQSCSPLIFD